MIMMRTGMMRHSAHVTFLKRYEGGKVTLVTFGCMVFSNRLSRCLRHPGRYGNAGN